MYIHISPFCKLTPFYIYRYGCQPILDHSPLVIRQIDESVATLQDCLNKDDCVYGLSIFWLYACIFSVIDSPLLYLT